MKGGGSPLLRLQRYGKGGAVEGGAKERGRLVDMRSWLCALYWSAREAILLRAVTNIGLYSEQYRLVREGLLLCVQTSRYLCEWRILGGFSFVRARVLYVDVLGSVRSKRVYCSWMEKNDSW